VTSRKVVQVMDSPEGPGTMVEVASAGKVGDDGRGRLGREGGPVRPAEQDDARDRAPVSPRLEQLSRLGGVDM